MTKKFFTIIVILLLCIFFLAGCGTAEQTAKKEAEGIFRIRFKDLVTISELQEYKDMKVEAVGFLASISPLDGSFAYLMNLPYQACPYCVPDNTKITNTLAIFPKENEKIEFIESAVIVTGTLRIARYTDEYGYSYPCRLVDVEIRPVDATDTEEFDEKMALYNELAEANVLTNIMTPLNSLDKVIFYEYSGLAVEDLASIDISSLNTAIANLQEINKQEFSILLEVAIDVKDLTETCNTLLTER